MSADTKTLINDPVALRRYGERMAVEAVVIPFWGPPPTRWQRFKTACSRLWFRVRQL